MGKIRVLVSLMTKDNGYQREQAASAQAAGLRLGVDVQIIYAGNDSINQSQQLLHAVQSAPDARPDAIVCCPVGTELRQVAYAAAGAGIGWGLLNRNADYITELRRTAKAPVCQVAIDQEEIGRIQARQFAALMPKGGMVLYIQGPATNPVVQARAAGMTAGKPANVQVRTLRGKWTDESGYEAVASWLRVATSHQTPIGLICSQNDDMAIGARKAFEENTSGEEREHFCSLPFTGCDACPDTGQEWIRKGLLTASITLPNTASIALEQLVKSLQSGAYPAERTTVLPSSCPPIERLTETRSRAVLAAR
ncbi:MAG TPA: sugar ABC transporter substrate-binding protein [Clostridia bacterium]|nr:sugar ABC transporter substrate-binding protein [Clostridia bacterium]